MRKEEMIAVLKDIQQNGVSLKNYSSIKKMIADLEDEVRHDNNKKSGTVSIEKAAKSIIKSGKEKPQTALPFEVLEYINNLCFEKCLIEP